MTEMDSLGGVAVPSGPLLPLAGTLDALDRCERQVRARIAAEIEQFADDDSDISDAYRHAAMIAKGIPGA